MQLAIFLSRGLVVETLCSCMFGAINQVYMFKKLSPVAQQNYLAFRLTEL